MFCPLSISKGTHGQPFPEPWRGGTACSPLQPKSSASAAVFGTSRAGEGAATVRRDVQSVFFNALASPAATAFWPHSKGLVHLGKYFQKRSSAGSN